jgi:putative CocE/NonD family hydrolase
MIGASYCAGNQIAAAREQPPHLGCIAPSAGGGDARQILESQMTLETITLSWSAMMAVDVLQKRAADGHDVSADMAKVVAVLADPADAAWTLPLDELSVLQIPGMPSYQGLLDVLRRAAVGFSGEEDRIEVPALVNTGWYDIGAGFELYHKLRTKTATARARTETKTIVGPWGHNGHEWNIGEWGNGQFASVGGARIPEAHLAFYLRHLKDDDSVPVLPNVRYFVMGARQWRDSVDWPPPGTTLRRYYLHSGGHANAAGGDGGLSERSPVAGEPPDAFRYDPSNPVPSWGLRVMYNGASTIHGPYDQHRIESRDDVLVYTAEPFGQSLEMSGELELHLNVSSSAPDTDFVAKVCVVDNAGISRNIADGFLRMRYRDSFDDPTFITPGDVYPVVMRLGPTSYRFRPGEALRLQLTSSCFPHWDRNLNTAEPLGEGRAGVIATNVVLHDPARPSFLVVADASQADSRPSVLPPANRPG